MSEFDRIAVVTIQGGGVYGLNLLGQLQSVLDQGIRPIALAGTSAGAIVSTLFWAGLQPEDIRDRFAELASTSGRMVDLVGPFDPAFDHTTVRDWVGRLAIYFGWAAEMVPVGRRHLGSGWLTSLLRFVWHSRTARRDLFTIAVPLANRGLFSGAEFEWFVDRLLRSSPQLASHTDLLPPPLPVPRPWQRLRVAGVPLPTGPRSAPRLLTFGDFRRVALERQEFFPYLMLTATNVSSGRLELFDSTEPRYRNLPVATAARVSGGFPGFFRPVDIDWPNEQCSYVDGGMICNFPAFVFADAFRQRLATATGFEAFQRQPWVHVGLRLTAGDAAVSARAMEDPKRYYGGLMRLLTGQARNDLEGRLAGFLSRTLEVEQPFTDTGGPTGVLDIDALDESTVEVMFRRGRARATEALERLTFDLPMVDHVRPILDSAIEMACRMLGDPTNRAVQLRANVFVRRGGQLEMLYWANMDDPAVNPDRGLTMDYRAGLSGYCLNRGQPVLCNLFQFDTLFAPDASPSAADRFGFTPGLQSRIRQDRTWLLSVPIFDPKGSYRRPLAERPVVPLADQHFVELDSYLDGGVFGVFNLDAAIDFDYPYGSRPFPSAPHDQQNDPRIRGVVNIARGCAVQLAEVLSASFAPQARN